MRVRKSLLTIVAVTALAGSLVSVAVGLQAGRLPVLRAGSAARIADATRARRRARCRRRNVPRASPRSCPNNRIRS
jgi:hypothetical protein